MRREDAKSCKNGLGRDKKIHLAPHYNVFYGWSRTAGQRIKRIFGRRGKGRRMTTNFIIGLRRRNNELNELTNFLATRKGAKHCSSLCSQSEGDGYVANLSEIYCRLCGAAAPVRGSYSRIGACPYLPPQLIDSRCCPCKGQGS